MTVDLGKRSWFTHGRSLESPLRPPWSLPESLFTEQCSRCGECIQVCPEQLIHKADGGFPEISFAQSGCDFCADCADVCPTPAINPELIKEPWSHQIAISDQCLTHHQVFCNSCIDFCDQQAIVFSLTKAIASPTVDMQYCNGCGMCISACPVSAIGIQR